MNINQAIRTSSMLLDQMNKIILRELPEDEKREKLYLSGKRIFETLHNALCTSPAHGTLLVQAKALQEATDRAIPSDIARVATLATHFLSSLHNLEQTVAKESCIEEKNAPKRNESRFFQRSEVVRLIERYPSAIVAKSAPMPRTLAQATKLTHRIVNRVYGEEALDALRHVQFSPEDLLLFLLLDSVLHGDGFSEIPEIFADISPDALHELAAINGLSPEHIAAVITGTKEKLSLPGGALWMEAVSSAYASNNEGMRVILSHMHSLFLPTLEQLLHIAIELPGDEVRSTLREAVAAEDEVICADLDRLLDIFDEKDDARTCALAKDEHLQLPLAELLTIMAALRPECATAIVDQAYRDGAAVSCDLSPEEVRDLNKKYGKALGIALRVASVKGGIERARALIQLISATLPKVSVEIMFIDEFRHTHPQEAWSMVTYLFEHPDQLLTGSANISAVLALFIKGKTAEEALQWAPPNTLWNEVERSLFSAILQRAAHTDIDEALTLLEKRLDSNTRNQILKEWETNFKSAENDLEEALELVEEYIDRQNTQVIRQLARYLGTRGAISELCQCLNHPSLATYHDLLRSAFVRAALKQTRNIGAQEILAIMNGIEDGTSLSLLCASAIRDFSDSDHIPIRLQEQDLVEELIMKTPPANRDEVLSFSALGYMRSGTNDDIQEAIRLASQINDPHHRGVVLLQASYEFTRLHPTHLPTFVSNCAANILMLLDGCDVDVSDPTRACLVELLSQSSNLSYAIEIVRTIQSPKNLAIALKAISKEIIAQRPEQYLASLQELIHLADRQPEHAKRCLQAVLRPAAVAERKTALQLLECVSEKNKDIAEAIIALAEEESESSASSDDT